MTRAGDAACRPHPWDRQVGAFQDCCTVHRYQLVVAWRSSAYCCYCWGGRTRPAAACYSGSPKPERQKLPCPRAQKYRHLFVQMAAAAASLP